LAVVEYQTYLKLLPKVTMQKFFRLVGSERFFAPGRKMFRPNTGYYSVAPSIAKSPHPLAPAPRRFAAWGGGSKRNGGVGGRLRRPPTPLLPSPLLYSARAQTCILNWRAQVNALPEILPHPLPPPRWGEKSFAPTGRGSQRMEVVAGGKAARHYPPFIPPLLSPPRGESRGQGDEWGQALACRPTCFRTSILLSVDWTENDVTPLGK